MSTGVSNQRGHLKNTTRILICRDRDFFFICIYIFHVVKAMVFPVVMYGCESWTVKKAERQRIDAFELWC